MAAPPSSDQVPPPGRLGVWDPAQLLDQLECGESLEEVLFTLCQQAEGTLAGCPVWLGVTVQSAAPMVRLATSGFPRVVAQVLDTWSAVEFAANFQGCGDSDLPGRNPGGALVEAASQCGFRRWAWASRAGRSPGPAVTLLASSRVDLCPPAMLATLDALAAFALRLVHEVASPLSNLHWQELSRRIFRALPEPALLVDALDGRILDANQAACRLYGYPVEDFRTRTLLELTAPGHPTGTRRRMHLQADGTPIAVEVTSTPLLEGPRPMALMLIRDATLESRTEEALRESEARFRGLFESAPVSIWEEDFSEVKTYLEGLDLPLTAEIAPFLESHPLHLQACLDRIHVRNTNLKTLELFGRSSHPGLFGHLSCFSDRRIGEVLGHELTAFRRGQRTLESEHRTASGPGDSRDIVLVARLAPGAEEDWSQVLVSIVDITDRNRALEELHRNRASLSEAQSMADMGSCEVDLATRHTEWSKGALRLLGIAAGQPIPPLRSLLARIPREDRHPFFLALRNLLCRGLAMDVELRVAWAEGAWRHIALKVRSEPDEGGHPARLMAAFQDITHRKQMEANLRESEALYRHLAEENAGLLARFRQEAEEKSMLLQEVNHRVKNNLTSILGMLDMELQDCQRTGSEAVHSFEDLKQRIFALSSVHELLSAAEWSPLRLESFATDLIRNTLAGTPVSHGVRLEVSPGREAVWVSPSSATALAMILAELTTNSAKYAFDRRGSGRITLRIRPLKDERNRVCLTYQDDGPGYPEEVLAGSRQNVGLQLIRLNVKSLLRGELILDNQRGARVRIAFQPMPLTRAATRRSES